MKKESEEYKYHNPVLLKESIEGLDIKPDGIYVDVTFGGGGHSRKILEKLNENGKLFAFDQDIDAKANLFDDKRLCFIKQNFRHLERFLKLYKIKEVDGVLADLGISSYQIDTPERGFSIRYNGPLDMRMDEDGKTTAQDVINHYTEQELADVFYNYGELRNARKLARAIASQRSKTTIRTIDDLKVLVNPLVHGNKMKVLAQIFQALRIEVNEELDALKQLLPQTTKVIKKSGRLVVISYHSLEDRFVKNFIRSGNLSNIPDKDIYGNFSTPFKAVNRKVICPTEQEISSNPRARSAKMRIAEKL